MRPSLNGAYQKEDGELGLEFLEGGKVVYQEKGSDPITLDYQVVKSQNGYKLVIGNKSEMIEKKGNSLILERSGELKRVKKLTIKNSEEVLMEITARMYLNSLGTLQIFNYIDKNTFSSVIDNTIDPPKGYSFQIFPIDNKDFIYIVAIPEKVNINAYILSVGVINKEPIKVMCESIEPTSEISEAPKKIDTDIQCPSGFQKTK
jgi:hypothetical protein